MFFLIFQSKISLQAYKIFNVKLSKKRVFNKKCFSKIHKVEIGIFHSFLIKKTSFDYDVHLFFKHRTKKINITDDTAFVTKMTQHNGKKFTYVTKVLYDVLLQTSADYIIRCTTRNVDAAAKYIVLIVALTRNLIRCQVDVFCLVHECMLILIKLYLKWHLKH